MGVYHGAWWYYLLSIPFLLFKGNPLGFYIFNFIIQFVSFICLLLLLNVWFGALTVLAIAYLVAISPYFIYASVFVGNNIMALVAFSFFLLLNGIIFLKKPASRLPILALLGISLGLVAEFEVAFGLFLIPTFVITALIFPTLRKSFLSLKGFASFLVGFIIPFLPRLLFEVKNNFQQTKIIFDFLLKPKLYNPKSYYDVLIDRMSLFKGYYASIFSSDPIKTLFTIILIAALILYFLSKEKKSREFLLFLFSVVGILFAFSTLYKDFFWSNYYEGIQYAYLLILATVFSVTNKRFEPALTSAKIGIIGFLVLLALSQSIQNFVKKDQVIDGLKKQKIVVAAIQKMVGTNKNYCVRVYTPPVIPYTYDYLFLYDKMTHAGSQPSTEWVDNQCYFILEADSFKERKDKWVAENIPAEKSSRLKKIDVKDISIQLWQIR